MAIRRSPEHISPIKRKPGTSLKWECKCACGKTVHVDRGSLRTGQISCGCAQREQLAKLNFKDLTNMRFGRWLVEGLASETRRAHGRNIILWKCVCDCGKTKNIATNVLTMGNSKSCGCLHHDRVVESGMRRHGPDIIPKCKTGYIFQRARKHPYKNAEGFVLQHRLVME